MLGLHARPAAIIAKIAQNAQGQVWISTPHDKVDASSVIDILTLGCTKGTEITLQIENAADHDLFIEISDYIERGLEEL